MHPQRIFGQFPRNLKCVSCSNTLADSCTTRRQLCRVCMENELQIWESGEKTHEHDRCETVEFLRLQLPSEPAWGVLSGDLLILVEGRPDEPLRAHKFILASKSPVFYRMFHTNMEGKTNEVLQINEATLPVMRAVVGFCYNAKTEFTDKVPAEEVLVVAHKYGIGLLVKQCEDHLVETMSSVNLPRRLKLARKFQAATLQAAAI